jgi:deoxycytidylate deaminase
MITKRDKNFLMKTCKLAEESEFTRARMACLAVEGNKIIGSGLNSHKTHPLQSKYNKFRDDFDESGDEVRPKLHAEMACLTSISSTLNDLHSNNNNVTIYIGRVKKNHTYGMARPCKACMQALKDYGIKHIVYTTDDGLAEEELTPSQHYNHNNLIVRPQLA